MDVFVIRGLPGSPAVEIADTLMNRPTDYVLDLSPYHETEQGHLFVTEELPDAAKADLRDALRAPSVSRLCVCAVMHKGWVERILEDMDVDLNVHWLVAEGAIPPNEQSQKFYSGLRRRFDIDLVKYAYD